MFCSAEGSSAVVCGSLAPAIHSRETEEPMKAKLSLGVAVCAFAVSATSAFAQIKIAYIDPLSGLMAATGEHGLHELEFAVEQLNAKGGVLGQKVELVPLDNKL